MVAVRPLRAPCVSFPDLGRASRGAALCVGLPPGPPRPGLPLLCLAPPNAAAAHHVRLPRPFWMVARFRRWAAFEAWLVRPIRSPAHNREVPRPARIDGTTETESCNDLANRSTGSRGRAPQNSSVLSLSITSWWCVPASRGCCKLSLVLRLHTLASVAGIHGKSD